MTESELIRAHNKELQKKYGKRRLKNKITWRFMSEDADKDDGFFGLDDELSIETEFQTKNKNRRLSSYVYDDEVIHEWRTYKKGKIDNKKLDMDECVFEELELYNSHPPSIKTLLRKFRTPDYSEEY